MLGFHAFTGNDYISSFFRKGEIACWKIVEKYPRFVSIFTSLGLSWELEEELADALEQYVCLLYGSRKKRVNGVRSEIFECKHVNQRKVIDIHSKSKYNIENMEFVTRPNVRKTRQISHTMVGIVYLRYAGWMKLFQEI